MAARRLRQDGAGEKVRLERLVERLYAHADVHGTHCPQDDEQRQWADDLREAASWLEQMSLALRIVHTWACVPGALDPKDTEVMTSNALQLPSGSELTRGKVGALNAGSKPSSPERHDV